LLTVPEDEAVNVIFINGTLIHRPSDEIPASAKVNNTISISKVPSKIFF